jgi:hypothetical protein
MSDSPSRAWSCPEWSGTYRQVVGALQRGEEPETPDEPLTFRRLEARTRDPGKPSIAT